MRGLFLIPRDSISGDKTNGFMSNQGVPGMYGKERTLNQKHPGWHWEILLNALTLQACKEIFLLNLLPPFSPLSTASMKFFAQIQPFISDSP